MDLRPALRRLAALTSVADGASSLLVESTLVELLARTDPTLQRIRGATRMWLGRVQAILDERFTAPPSLGELADAVGVHPAHLTRAFRLAMGCSVGCYVRRLRVEYACRRIEQGNTSLADIALAAGFADQSHMNRLIRAEVGRTPAALRAASLREKSSPDRLQ